MNSLQIDILDGRQSILVKILRLAWPVTISMLLQSSYSLVDMFYVAQLGEDAIAAVTLTGILMFAVFALSRVFAAGMQSMVARSYGLRNLKNAEVIFRDGLVGGILAGLVIGVIVMIQPDRVLDALQAEPGVVRVGTGYVSVMAAGSAGMIGLLTLGAGFRGAGDSVSPLVLATASTILNMVLDPILIFGLGPIPALGTTGAAIATIISMYLGLAWGISFCMRRNASVRLEFKKPPQLLMLLDLLKIGIPMGLHYVLLWLTSAITLYLVAGFGTLEVAASGIVSRITQVAFVAIASVGEATATMTGQYLGAGRPLDAKRSAQASVRLCFIFNSLFSLVLAFYSPLFLSAFTSDAQTVALGTAYMKLSSIMLVCLSITITLSRAFQGAGYTMWPTVIMGVRFATFGLFAYLLAWKAALLAPGVWLAVVISAAIQSVLIAFLYAKGSWTRTRLRSLDAATPEAA
jgi:putative MATE family efflux protein